MNFLFTFSLRRQVNAINKLSNVGMYFWDYGNAFLHQASLAGLIGNFDSYFIHLIQQRIYLKDSLFSFV